MSSSIHLIAGSRSFIPLRQEVDFFSYMNSRSLKGHSDTVTFEIVMSNPREQDVREPLGGTSMVGMDI